MGAGGATWETAGLLEEGAAGVNSFTVASGAAPYKRGWWKFTATERKHVTINLGFSTFVGAFKQLTVTVYSGDEDPDSAVFVTHGPSGSREFYTVPGVTYRVMAKAAKLSEVDLVLAYRPVLTVSDPLPAATPWISTLQDNPGNVLTVTEGDLIADNPPGFDTPGVHLWFGDLIDTVRPPGRFGEYLIQETLAGHNNGHLVIDSASCAWSHAVFGDNDGQLWNTSGTDPDDGGTPVCRNLIDGFADPALNDAPNYSLQHTPSNLPFVSGSMEAEAKMRARGLWLQHARDHLLEAGVLSASLDPVADGVPEEFADDAEIEYEGPLQLVKVEVTGDTAGRPAEGTEPNGVTFFLNDKILPSYVEGWVDRWRKGSPGTWNEDPDHPHRVFDYDDGDPVWTELTEFTSWEDLSDYTADEPPDTLVGICMSMVFTGMPAVDTSAGNFSDIAVRLTFESPRYRWLYNGPTTVPPRRIFGRSDGATHGARRVSGGGNTVQSGNRTIGAIL